MSEHTLRAARLSRKSREVRKKAEAMREDAELRALFLELSENYAAMARAAEEMARNNESASSVPQTDLGT